MKAIYAGSFDPPTLGHRDLVARAAAVVGELVVAIGEHPDKRTFVPLARRVELLRTDCAGLGRIEVATFAGATVAFAKECGADVLIRGLRSTDDLERERAMAAVNRRHGFETLFLSASTPYLDLSSSLVRQVLAAGLPLDDLVSPAVAACLAEL